MEEMLTGKIVLAAGVPHAPQLVTRPERWPDVHKLVMCASSVRKKELEQETLEDNRRQLDSAKRDFARIRAEIERVRPDVILALTDDHFDNFFLDDYPPFAIFVGPKVEGDTIWIRGRRFQYRCDAAFSRRILNRGLEQGFDLTFSEEVHLEYGHLVPLSYLNPESRIPIIPIYTNAYASPQPTPSRCHQLGRFLGQVIREGTDDDYRVALVASGGMSHYPGETLAGEVDARFDRKMMEMLRAGRNREFAEMTSEAIDESGNTEMRSWIVMLGALGRAKPVFTDYILSWRAIIGLGFALWVPKSRTPEGGRR